MSIVGVNQKKKIEENKRQAKSSCRLFLSNAFRQLSTEHTKQKSTRYAGGRHKVILMANKINSLSHTKWMCKYHIVFAPKYRRKIIYNQYRKDMKEIIKALCKYKGVYADWFENRILQKVK